MYNHPLFVVGRTVFICSALINIILILALRATENRTRSACHKGLQTVLADADRFLCFSQHKAEHHLYSKYQRVEIPYNRQLVC